MHPAATPAPGLWRAVHAARPRGPLTRSIVRRVTVACAAFAATPSPPRRRPPARDRFVPCDSRRVIGGVVGRPSGRPAVRPSGEDARPGRLRDSRTARAEVYGNGHARCSCRGAPRSARRAAASCSWRWPLPRCRACLVQGRDVVRQGGNSRVRGIGWRRISTES